MNTTGAVLDQVDHSPDPIWLGRPVVGYTQVHFTALGQRYTVCFTSASVTALAYPRSFRRYTPRQLTSATSLAWAGAIAADLLGAPQ